MRLRYHVQATDTLCPLDVQDPPDEAFRLACEWHGGQWAPLYAFLSTGTVEVGLARELRQCIASAEKHAPEDVDPLREFLEWAERAEDAIPADDDEAPAP